MALTEQETQAVQARLEREWRAGCGPKLTPEQRDQLVRDWLADERVTKADLARRYGITPQATSYLLRRAARRAVA